MAVVKTAEKAMKTWKTCPILSSWSARFSFIRNRDSFSADFNLYYFLSIVFIIISGAVTFALATHCKNVLAGSSDALDLSLKSAVSSSLTKEMSTLRLMSVMRAMGTELKK